MTSVWGIVVAAGEGTRFGGPKHSEPIEGRAMWEHARDTLREGGCDQVVVVGPVPGGVVGGASRRDSVAAGLAQLPPPVSHVLVHDAARPAATTVLVQRVIGRLLEGDADAVIPALPITDTIKEVEAGVVMGTIDRERLVAVQTPQGFVRESLASAHQRGGSVTDDAQLIELAGGRVVVVEGEPGNLKVTYPGDLERVIEEWRRSR